MSKKLTLGLLIATGAVMFSCSKKDLYDPNGADELRLAQYETAFKKKYGKISANQDWGFGLTTATRTTSVATRGTVTKGNNISHYVGYYDVPELITEEERTRVTAAFANNEGQNVGVDQLNWSDFFVQHISVGNHSYTYTEINAGNGERTPREMENATTYMNQIKCGEMEVNDFNAGTEVTDKSVQYQEYVDKNGVTHRNESKAIDCLLLQGFVSKFSYKNSLDGGNYYSNYIIKEIDGAYYVGFDFACNSSTVELIGDGIYDDWIIKVVPAKYAETYRIMAEDLAVTDGDFDFNDVVFDAAIINGEAVITLQAAGGTMPLYVGDKEVHDLFGVNIMTMVNTFSRGERIPVMFRLAGYNNVKDIPITVNGITLGAETGKAPGKLCCPAGRDWADETQNIESKYTAFEEAVRTGTEWWIK